MNFTIIYYVLYAVHILLTNEKIVRNWIICWKLLDQKYNKINS